MNYTFRKYTDKDYDFIYDLKKISYQKYVEAIWGPWDDKKQHEFFDSYIAQQKDRIKIVVIDGKDVGYFDDKVDGRVYEIVNICLLPECQGKGIGTDILKNAIAENKGKAIDIQCFIANPVNKLYERLGFVEKGRTKTHIQMHIPTSDKK